MAEITSSETKEALLGAPTRRIFTVSELTQDIKKLLETGFDAVWVKGEVSSFKSPSSGHFYFSLKDEKTLLNCVMFRFRAQSLSFRIEDGLEMICGGRITLYEPRGSYQLLVDVIEPVGRGALQLRFEQLKEKLDREGLFEKAHKKSIPYLPQKIALITSPTGAVIQDMLQIIGRRFPNVEILLIPVSVQGEKAAPEIVRALHVVNEIAEHDVIILGRGGGSLEDLWAFNEEIVARAIFASQIPVVSAVGHEVDFTIADFVADLRAPTPSAAAELVVKNKSDLNNLLLNLLQRLHQSYLKTIHIQKNTLSILSGRLINPKRKLEDWRLRLSDLEEHLIYTLFQNLKNAKSRLNQISPKLSTQIQIFLERKRKHIEQLSAVLKNLNPLAILERGYSITQTKDHAIIRKANETQEGDLITIRLSQGQLRCEVKNIILVMPQLRGMTDL